MKIEDALILQGWTQGEYRNPVNGEVCFYGAIYYAEFESWDAWCTMDDEVLFDEDPRLNRRCIAAGIALEEWCQEHGVPMPRSDLEAEASLAIWNDDPERNKDEIFALARRADEILEEL